MYKQWKQKKMKSKLLHTTHNHWIHLFIWFLYHSICYFFSILFIVKRLTIVLSPHLNHHCYLKFDPIHIPDYTNHEIEKETDCSVPSSQSSAKKLPLAITTRRYPLDRLQSGTTPVSGATTAAANLTDSYITTGGLCETTFLELNDPSANLDVNFIEFKQHPNQQPPSQHQHQQSVQQLSTLSKQPSQYPSLLNANGYEMEIVPTTDLSLYGSSCKPSQAKCYLSEANDFVGVSCLDISSLDILQGVRQGQSYTTQYMFMDMESQK